MERSDKLLILLFGMLLVSQVAAVWLGVKLEPRFGWASHAVAVTVPPLAALVLLALLLRESAPCPPGPELQCGEGFVALLFTGTACAGANFLFSLAVQFGVWAHRRQTRFRTTE